MSTMDVAEPAVAAVVAVNERLHWHDACNTCDACSGDDACEMGQAEPVVVAAVPGPMPIMLTETVN
jgi:hypothetical protein